MQSPISIQDGRKNKNPEQVKNLVEACLDELVTTTALLGEINQRVLEIKAMLGGKQ